MNKKDLAKEVNNSNLLFYGELEGFLDEYIKEFFKVEVKEVGFDDNHKMNNLQFWLVVSWLVSMDYLEYGTSPRGVWLTEEGEYFKNYCLNTETPISNLTRMEPSEYEDYC